LEALEVGDAKSYLGTKVTWPSAPATVVSKLSSRTHDRHFLPKCTNRRLAVAEARDAPITLVTEERVAVVRIDLGRKLPAVRARDGRILRSHFWLVHFLSNP
jgi:hypothetical protein